MNEPTPPQLVRFSIFEANLDSGELFKKGQKVKLQGQPFDLLVELLKNPGSVVTRDQLKERLWPGAMAGDFDSSLNRAINRIREVLGDSAESPHFIETIPRRGYRFIGTVSSAGGVESTPAATPGRQRWPLSRLLLAGAGLCMIIALATFLQYRPSAPSPLLQQQRLQFTSLPGVETMPAFSPDGRRLAFVHSEHDPLALHLLGRQVAQASIYVKLVGAGEELRLTNGVGADFNPAWSPDGEYVAFYRDSPGGSGYFVVPSLGGSERRIAGGQAASAGIAWFPGGNRLAAAQLSEGSDASPLYEISVETGTRRPLTSPPAGTLGDAWPTFSPDGTTLAFARLKDSRAFDLCLLQLSGRHTPRCSAVDGALPAGLAWTASGDGLIGSSVIKTAPRLWRYDLRSASLSMLTTGEQVAEYPAVSGDGTIAYVISTRRANIYQLDIPFQGHGPGIPKPVAASSTVNADPAYSPDARKIAFASVRGGGSTQIWVAATGAPMPTQLTHMPHGCWLSRMVSGRTADSV